MLIEQLISPVIPTLRPTDTGGRALYLMEENHLTQLPLVVEEKYLALVRENELLDWNTPESPLSGGDFLKYKPAVIASGHPYEALRIAHLYDLDIVPVVDRSNTYLGAITRNSLLHFITENGGLANPGGIIVLEIPRLDYSLTDVARICENERVVITSTQLGTDMDGEMFYLTLKTDRTDLGGVVSSFERHGYRIKEVFGEQGHTEDMLERYKNLMSYINV